MTQATLRTIALATVANYSHVAGTAVDAYRRGGHRLIAAMQRRIDRAAALGAQVLVPQFATVVRRASEQMGAFAVKGVDALSSGTERAIELGAAGVTAQVERVAGIAERLDGSAFADGIDAAARISLPGAKAALKVSERVAAHADKMAVTLRGRKTAQPEARTEKRAQKTARPVRRTARKATVEAAAKTPRRAAKRGAPAQA